MFSLVLNMFTATFGIIVLLVAICNPSTNANPIELNWPSNERIAGGFETRPGQFRYIVSLRRHPINHFCGGSVISDRWIIAHCTNDIPSESIEVVADAHLVDDAGTSYETSQNIVHIATSVLIITQYAMILLYCKQLPQ